MTGSEHNTHAAQLWMLTPPMGDDKKDIVLHQDHAVLDAKPGAPKVAGMAVIDITHTIPSTGKRKVTTKWEYWTYCASCES